MIAGKHGQTSKVCRPRAGLANTPVSPTVDCCSLYAAPHYRVLISGPPVQPGARRGTGSGPLWTTCFRIYLGRSETLIGVASHRLTAMAAQEPIPVYTQLNDLYRNLGTTVDHATRWNTLAEEFEKRFGRKPAYIARAPGRVKYVLTTSEFQFADHTTVLLVSPCSIAIHRD